MTIDSTESQIVDDIRATLRGLRDPNGKAIFGDVDATDDADSFIRTAAPEGKVIAAVVYHPSERRKGLDDSEVYVKRLPLEIVLKGSAKPDHAGADETSLALLNNLAATIRDGLLIDRSRGGRANLIEWDGVPLNGTDVDGPARMISRQWRDTFAAVTIPVAVGISKLA